MRDVRKTDAARLGSGWDIVPELCEMKTSSATRGLHPVICRCHGRKFTSEQSLGLHFWHERRKRIAALKAAGYSTVHAKTVASISIATDVGIR